MSLFGGLIGRAVGVGGIRRRRASLLLRWWLDMLRNSILQEGTFNTYCVFLCSHILLALVWNVDNVHIFSQGAFTFHAHRHEMVTQTGAVYTDRHEI